MKFDSLKRRLQALEPAPAIPSFLGLETLSDAEIDARVKSLIRRLEIRRCEQGEAMPDFLHKELTCEGCTGNNRAAWCYSRQGDDLQICPPLR